MIWRKEPNYEDTSSWGQLTTLGKWLLGTTTIIILTFFLTAPLHPWMPWR